MEAVNGIQEDRGDINNMKTFASALIGLSLMIGTVMAQTPAPSTSTDKSTDTTKPASKVKKHKKKAAAPATTPAPAAAASPDKAPAK